MVGAVFPWREGNRFELLIDGPRFFPRMLAAIDRATEQVELELYLVEAGACAEAMVQALVHAAERGVRVRCLFDDYGSLAFTLRLRQRLTGAGVELRFYNRLSWRRGGAQPVSRSPQAAAGRPVPGSGGRHRGHR